MYASVPTIAPASVSDACVSVVAASRSLPSSGFASPKSSTFARPSGVMTTLALLKSRCTTPCSCACASASAIWCPRRTTSSTDIRPPASRSLSACPATSSIAM